jgi:hypothetical protein
MAARAHLAVLRSRSALVDSRTQMINHVRGSIKPFGVRLPASSTSAFARQAAWKIPRELRPALVPILRTIADLSRRIVKSECRIEHLAAEDSPGVVGGSRSRRAVHREMGTRRMRLLHADPTAVGSSALTSPLATRSPPAAPRSPS